VRKALVIGVVALLLAAAALPPRGERPRTRAERASAPANRPRLLQDTAPRGRSATQAATTVPPATATETPPLQGRTIGPDGRPCAATVVAHPVSNPFGSEVRFSSGEDGLFASPVACGEWLVHAERNRGQSPLSSVVIAPDEAVHPLELELAEVGTVRGRVLDEESRACPGARICLLERIHTQDDLGPWPSTWTTADADGRYEMAVPAGEDDLQANATGHASATERMHVEAGGILDADLRLARASELHGRVVDTGGRPIPDAEVLVRDVDFGLDNGGQYPRERSTRAGPEGAFRVADLRAQCYDVDARAEGYMESTEWYDTTDAKPIEVVLSRPAAIEGGVRGPAPARLGLRRPSDAPEFLSCSPYISHSLQQQTSSDGSFRLGPIPPGRWIVQAKADGMAMEESGELEVREGEVLRGVALTLARGGNIRGTIRCERTGRPSGNARISEIRDGRAGSDYADGSGRFELRDLAPGRHALRFCDRGLATVETTVDVPEGGLVERDILLPEGTRLKVTVRVDGAEPDPDTWVGVAGCEPGEDRTVSRQAPDTWEASGLTPGTWMVTIHPQTGRLAARTRFIEVGREANASVRIELRTSPRVAGVARCGGKPAAGRGLVFLGRGALANELVCATANEQGGFVVPGLDNGPWAVFDARAWRVTGDPLSGLPRVQAPAGARTIEVAGDSEGVILDLPTDP